MKKTKKEQIWHPKIKRLLGTDLGTGHNFGEINFTEQGVGHYLGGQYILGAVSGPGLWPLSYPSHNAAQCERNYFGPRFPGFISFTHLPVIFSLFCTGASHS